jgi:hypothetical protein
LVFAAEAIGQTTLRALVPAADKLGQRALYTLAPIADKSALADPHLHAMRQAQSP